MVKSVTTIKTATTIASQTRRRPRGFTLIELLVVMTIIAALLSIVAPRYFESVDRAKEVALRTDLRLLREAIDKHRADTGHLPEGLQQLAAARYLREVPVDPITDRADSWIVVAAPDTAVPGVYDVRSGAPGNARDGSAYSSW
jgi:general secretion pathway protein G